MPSKIKKLRPEKNRHPKSFSNFLIVYKNIDFRDFLYELEIAETFENATTDTSIRYQNLRLKKYVFFFNISSDLAKFPQLVQISTELLE